MLYGKNFAEHFIPRILNKCRLIEDNEYCGKRTSVSIVAHVATDDVDAPVDGIGIGKRLRLVPSVTDSAKELALNQHGRRR